MVQPFRLLYPLRTYLVVSGRLGEEVNVMAADWVTIVSVEPFIVAVAIAPTRYTYKLIEKYGEFVISVPGLEHLRDVWIAGSEHGPGKLAKTSFKLKPGSRINTPIIEDALANLECRVINRQPVGDHVLYLAEVVSYSYRQDAYGEELPNIDAGFIAHLGRDKFVSFERRIIKP